MPSCGLCIVDMFPLGNELSEKLLIPPGPPDAQRGVSFFLSVVQNLHILMQYTLQEICKGYPFQVVYYTYSHIQPRNQKFYSLIFKK